MMNYRLRLIKSRQTMQEMSTLRGMEKERLKTLIESMGSGLLMFGREVPLTLLMVYLEKHLDLKTLKLLVKTVKYAWAYRMKLRR